MNKRSITLLLYVIGLVTLIVVGWVLIHQITVTTRISNALGRTESLSTNTAAHELGFIAPQALTTNRKRLDHKHCKGTVISGVVEIGPIDIHRKYHSMQGPEVKFSFRIGKLIASKKLIVPASRVHLIENENPIAHEEQIHQRNNLVQVGPGPVQTIRTIAAEEIGPPELYWFKGVKVDVLDENDKVMPMPEFLCHVNVDTVTRQHYSFFPCVKHSIRDRMVILSQGATRVMLPPGSGVPFADKERLRISLQAINKTTDRHRRIKLRMTFYFIKDQDLSQPMSALNWGTADLIVAAKGSNGRAMKSECISMCCTDRSQADDAPNNWLHRVSVHRALPKNSDGHRLSWHWMVTPGVHTYYSPVNDEQYSKLADQGPIRAVWLHVHPFCKSVSLIENIGGQRRVLYTAKSQTVTAPGLEIRHNDFLVFPKGIVLNKNAHYGLESVYNNTSRQPQDAMVIAGMFFSDLRFKRPSWAMGELTALKSQ